MNAGDNKNNNGIRVGQRLRYTIPNSFTAMSLLLGVASIFTGQLGNLELAGWMIVWCGLLDVMDGLTARMLKATSDFGAEFDSMADLIAFGVAPAMLMLQVGLDVGGIALFSPAFWVLLSAVGVFVLCVQPAHGDPAQRLVHRPPYHGRRRRPRGDDLHHPGEICRHRGDDAAARLPADDAVRAGTRHDLAHPLS
jgi:hypothetical protein